MKIRHVILDRDGVLNREDPDGGWVSDPRDWEWEPGSLEGLVLLREASVRISVATNQSGVGRGLFPLERVEAVHERMLREAAEAGGRIDAVFVCPHAPENDCGCRKPRPGLVRQAIAASGVPEAQTVLIGDAARDLEAAAGSGVRALLVRTGRGRRTEDALEDRSTAVYDDLRSAVVDLLGIGARESAP